MKFVCLGYFDDKKWEALSETEQKAFIEECFAYDGVLRKGGHIAGGEALEPPRNATTLRSKNGNAIVTDGPYAETKEQVGGILILEARDRKHAIELISKHPGLRNGPVEIRARDEAMTAAFEESGSEGRKSGGRVKMRAALSHPDDVPYLPARGCGEGGYGTGHYGGDLPPR